ncbi:MAG: hypothetical protein V3574_00230 [Candidatus Moraniibacteriota bacterium]
MKDIQREKPCILGKDLNNLAKIHQLARKIIIRLDPEHIWGESDLRRILENSLRELDGITLKLP